MKKDQTYKSLKEFTEKISKLNITWRMEGSTNLYVQNVEVEPKDLDIVVDKKSFFKLKEVLKENIKEKRNSEIKAMVLKGELAGAEFEILFYENNNLRMLDKIQKLKWENLELNILPLKHARKLYKLINRPDKVKLIEKHLRN